MLYDPGVFWDIALGLVMLVMAVLGGLVAIRPPVKPWAQYLFVGLFLLLGCIGMFSVVRQSSETAATRGRLDSKIADLAEAQAKNTRLQESLLSQSATLSRLAQQSIKSTVGGDSFCHMKFEGASLERGRPSPWFFQSGQYPLYDINATIINVVALRSVSGNRGLPLLDVPQAARTMIRVGDIGVDLGRVMFGTVIPFSGGADQYFRINYSARNGTWNQILRLHLVAGKWSMATQVSRKEGKDEKVIYQEVEASYPRTRAGQIDWELTADD